MEADVETLYEVDTSVLRNWSGQMFQNAPSNIADNKMKQTSNEINKHD